jgi:chemotaxis methyl-accepting protein methylase
MASSGTLASTAPALSASELGELVRLVARRTGVDLGGQRPSTLGRRAAGRLGACGARSAAEYLALLRADAAEPWRLLERLTIKVSRLFRNPDTFAAIRAQVLPELRSSRGERELRVWSAGCACGEEAYGLAMLCAEAGGAFRVVGTDVDRAALARARAGAYRATEIGQVPPELAARHLLPREAGVVSVRPELARRVRFEPHDLASSAPPGAPGRFDLVACRNVLIYYVAERQAQLLASVLGSLAPGGYLVLGEAEWPVPSAERRLEVVDRAHRIFRLPASEPERSWR